MFTPHNLLSSRLVQSTSYCFRRDFQTLFRVKKRKNFYAVLDIPRGATPRQIKKSYLRLAKIYHPDRTKVKNGAQKFRELQEAYGVLGDEASRQAYDKVIMEDMSTIFEKSQKVDINPGARDRNINVDAAFKKVFGTVRKEEKLAHIIKNKKYGRTQVGEEITEGFIVSISLEEAAKGCKKETDILGVAVCSSCDGSKAASGYRVVRCPFCDDDGLETIRKEPVPTKSTCRVCKGSKQYNRFMCDACEGYGYHINKKTACFVIPGGIKDNEKLKLVIKDHVFWIVVKIKKDPYYRIENSDVHTDAEISVAQAIFGGKTKIKGLYGIEEVAISPSTSSHDYIRLARKGLPKDNGLYGDHYVHFRIKVPSHLDPEVKNIFGEYAEHEGDIPGTVNGILQTIQGPKYVAYDRKGRSILEQIVKTIIG